MSVEQVLDVWRGGNEKGAKTKGNIKTINCKSCMHGKCVPRFIHGSLCLRQMRLFFLIVRLKVATCNHLTIVRSSTSARVRTFFVWRKYSASPTAVWGSLITSLDLFYNLRIVILIEERRKKIR